MSYYIGEYIEKQRTKQKFEFQNTKLLTQQRNGKDVGADLRIIEMKIEEIDKEIKKLGDQFEQGSLTFTGTAFITFQEEQEAANIANNWKMGDWEFLLCSCCSSHKFEGHVIQVKQAPEPTDVLWENWGYSKVYLLGQRIATQFYSLLLLGLCFAIIIGISYVQDKIKRNNTESSVDPTNTVLSLISSLCILTINFIIIFVLKKVVSLEKHGTFTNFNVSVAKKIGLAQFLNTAIVTLAINAIINGRKVQVEAALKYAGIIKTLLTTAFYAPFLPVGLIFGIGSLIIQYWLDKYLLLRRYAKPQNLGAELSNAMINFFMEIVLIAYALGCLYSEYIMYDKISIGTLITLIFSGIYFILPMDKIFVDHIRLCSCKLEKDFTQRKYDEVKNEFFSAYDRTNPATMATAMSQWTKLLAQDKYSEQQQQQKPTRLNAFNFYAQMKSGLSAQVYQYMGSSNQAQIQAQRQLQQQQMNPMFRQQMMMNMMQPQQGIMRNQQVQMNSMNVIQRNQYFNQMRMQQFMPMMNRQPPPPLYQSPSQQFSQPLSQPYQQIPSRPMQPPQMANPTQMQRPMMPPQQPSQPMYPQQQPQQYQQQPPPSQPIQMNYYNQQNNQYPSQQQPMYQQQPQMMQQMPQQQQYQMRQQQMPGPPQYPQQQPGPPQQYY